MSLDPDLLHDGRVAASRLHDARLQTEIATAEFHHALRRLNVAGASRREIAAAFDLSHQRVDQIVAGGNGRFRDWLVAGRRSACVMTCSFCPPTAVDPVMNLVHGPGVAICEGCADTVGVGPALDDPALRCSFCRRHNRPERTRLHGGPSATVCTECLQLVGEIQRRPR